MRMNNIFNDILFNTFTIYYNAYIIILSSKVKNIYILKKIYGISYIVFIYLFDKLLILLFIYLFI